MGNSPSSSPTSKWCSDKSFSISISKPSDLSRRASAQPTTRSIRETRTPGSNNMLAVPSTPRHRRSRSANAAIRVAEAAPPPPPYSYAPPPASIPPPVSQSMRSSPTAESPLSETDAMARTMSIGSRHTNVFTAPAAARSRPARTSSYLRTPMRQQTKEDALETLRKYNTIMIVDDSSSMRGALWTEATTALASLAELAGQYDTDGIDIYFLNDQRVMTNTKNAVEVKALFTSVVPTGITPIGERLEDLLQDYLYQIERAYGDGGPAALKAIKPVNYIIITDGIPTDDPESVIVQAARRLDAGNFPLTQIGIQFVQIGSSRKATKFLKELDDALQERHNIRDIVDTTPYIGLLNADALIKILLGGINRRIDISGAEAVTS